MARNKDNTLILKDKKKIIDFLGGKSNDMVDYVNDNIDFEYTLICKYITHSDLATFGKMTKKDDNLEKMFYLIYLSAKWKK